MELNVTYRGFTLDSFQTRAITELENGHSLVLAAPTGSGKTLVAEYLIEKVLQTDQRIVYTSPIKALSNQKFRDFSKLYGNKIGILTGDVVINQGAQALIVTTEVYRNMAIEDPQAISDVAFVIFDEIHFLGDIERGTVWEESIIFSPKTVKFLALSATIPNGAELAHWIETVADQKVSLITHNERAVPLSYLFYYQKKLMPYKELLRRVKSHEDAPREEEERPRGPRRGKKDEEDLRHFAIIKSLDQQDRLPLLYFVFSRAIADKMARESARHFDFTTPEEKFRIREMTDACLQKYGLTDLDSANELVGILENGVGKHHAGILPQMKELVEILFSERLLKVLFVTETFAVGVNMPARTTAFDALKKFDGRSFRPMKSLEFCQISGRAGRRGIDKIGYVVVPHLPRDLTIEELEKLVYGDIEPLLSAFDLSFNSVLNLYAGRETGEVRMILRKNFAQFQANKQLPELAGKVALYRAEMDRVMPRCTEKTNDLAAFMEFNKRRQDTIQSLNSQSGAIQSGLRGRRNRPHQERIQQQYAEKLERLKAEENEFICGKCASRNRCTAQYNQAARVEKKLDFWRGKVEELEELQLPMYEKKLGILRQLGYLDDNGLMPRGVFASHIHTEEISITELYFRGFFHEATHHEINALSVALVFEYRRRGNSGEPRQRTPLSRRLREAKGFVGSLSRRYSFVKPLEPALAMVMFEWSSGAPFEEIMAMTDVPEGDLIRTFRMSIDVLRQIREAADDRSLRDKLDVCLGYINRDIVLATELRD